jgi:hypothetical protein
VPEAALFFYFPFSNVVKQLKTIEIIVEEI